MIVYRLFTPYLSKKTKPLELAVLTVFEKNEKWLKGQKVETSHPYFALLLDENYFKPHSTVHLMTSELLEHHQPRTFILWDSHFGPLESHINLESLIKNPKYQLISAEKSLGNTVYLFQAK